MNSAPDHTQEPIIRTVLERYFNALDSGDFDRLATCFTQDAEYELNLDTKVTLSGREAVVGLLRDMPRPFASSHALANSVIDVGGDAASATSFAVVHVVMAIDGGRVLVRGIRYDDRLRREAGIWRIAQRRHNPLWQYEAVATRPQV